MFSRLEPEAQALCWIAILNVALVALAIPECLNGLTFFLTASVILSLATRCIRRNIGNRYQDYGD